MKWCPENKFEVTFFNSLLCSLKSFRFIGVFLISLIFTLLLFLIISDIYTVFISDIPHWINFKNKNGLFGFNLYTLSTVIVFILDGILLSGIYYPLTDVKKFWIYVLINIPMLAFVGFPFWEEFKWNVIFHKFLLYKLSLEYFLFFLSLIIIWVLSFIFITFIVEKKLLDKNVEKDKNV